MIPVERLVFTNGEEEIPVLMLDFDWSRHLVRVLFEADPDEPTSPSVFIPGVPEGQEIPVLNYLLDDGWRLEVKNESERLDSI